MGRKSCKSYRIVTRKEPVYGKHSEEIIRYELVKFGKCMATKNHEECDCEGDRENCSFYDDVAND